MKKETAYYHLPGLFEFYELYRVFLPLFCEHREYFYEWCEIGSIYGAPADCIWGGGRVGFGEHDPQEVFDLMQEYGISARLTFSNSLLKEMHLTDKKCNALCELFEQSYAVRTDNGDTQHNITENNDVKQNSAITSNKRTADRTLDKDILRQNGIIIHSDLLLNYLKEHYPNFYFVSSTTKVLTNFEAFCDEVKRDDFNYVVPDFRLNKQFDQLNTLTDDEKDKVEFLCNECCWFGCTDRKRCYEAVSRKNLGEKFPEHHCVSPEANEGYRFSKAMQNPGFISIEDIQNIYMPMGFSNFKIEGRGLGSALILEFLLYYMTKPEFQLQVREVVYLDSMLDLF